MDIQSATFVVSSAKVSQCPLDDKPEYAFVGRSNVGKSSLINMLTQRKSLAKTSGTPGKTQLINHFDINNKWYLVDLPGYGYAKVSKSAKHKFQRLITNYFENRDQLTNAFVLIDIRHDPQPIDIDFIEWLGIKSIPFSLIFTKVDKLSDNIIKVHVNKYMEVLSKNGWQEHPPYFISSAVKKMGRKTILSYIKQINIEIRKG